ncbi:hypothetical protein ACFRKE_07025 [Kitasatospora indigofera]|uniref:hypothetical protein n=1 Tax=Kitasatospora indigofera TaxID=67307 RepID=UPI0036C13946
MLDQAAALPPYVLASLIRDASLLSLTNGTATDSRGRWAQAGGGFETAQQYAPDAVPQIAQSLRWLLSHDPDRAANTYGLIAHQGRHRFDIPIAFSAGWLASNLRWAGGRAEDLPLDVDIDAFVLAATSEEALKAL